MSGAAYIDKRGREPGSGLTPDKEEARVDLGSGSDASAIVQHHRVIRARPRVARA